MALITLMKGQPLTYNKDNQEDKEPLFDTVDTVKDTLRIMAEMVGGEVDTATGTRTGGLTAKPDAMERAAKRGYATATDLADYLVRKGVPFRDAHEVVAHAVKVGIDRGLDLSELPLDVLQGFHASIGEDVYEVLTLKGSLNARRSSAGRRRSRQCGRLRRHRARLG
jgi:argininosuccinate lyase